MTYQIIPASCVELSVSVYSNRYLAELQVDGVSRDQLEFQAECQLAEWASAILCTTGGSLYVRVQPFEASHWRMVLQLVGELSVEGITISISGQRSVCRSKNRRLQ